MSLLKRLSASFWSLASPQTPRSNDRYAQFSSSKDLTVPSQQTPSNDQTGEAQHTSPNAPDGKSRTLTQHGSRGIAVSKRKRQSSPHISAGRRSKLPRTDADVADGVKNEKDYECYTENTEKALAATAEHWAYMQEKKETLSADRYIQLFGSDGMLDESKSAGEGDDDEEEEEVSVDEESVDDEEVGSDDEENDEEEDDEDGNDEDDDDEENLLEEESEITSEEDDEVQDNGQDRSPDDTSEEEVDDSQAAIGKYRLVVGATDSPSKAKRGDVPMDDNVPQMSVEELRGQGWDDDYITLIQRIVMRGYEPLLPAYLKFEYSNIPDGLFESADNAFISSVSGGHFKAGKALERLFELGGRVRDRLELASRVRPEVQVRRELNAYLEWAYEDGSLDKSTMIPILAASYQPAGTPAAKLRAHATKQCRRLAQRYLDRFLVVKTTERSPGAAPRTSPPRSLTYAPPTFYAIVASHAVVAIMAYRHDSDDAQVSPMAFFDFRHKDYDVWNSLALAILVCHVRNVQMRIAEDTGLGRKPAGKGKGKGKAESDYDPDV